MLTVVLALLAAAGYSGSDFTGGLAARGADVVRVTLVAEVISCVLIVAALPLVSSQSPTSAALAWGAVAGASGTVAAMALYLGFRYAAFSVVSSVSAVGSTAFSVVAGLLLGERPGPAALAGIALALPAIAAVSMNTDQKPAADAGLGDPNAPGAQSRRPARRRRSRQPEHPGANRADPNPVNNSSPADHFDTAGNSDTTKDSSFAATPSAAGRRHATGQHAAGVVCGVIAGAGFGLFFLGLNQAGSSTDLWPLATASAAGVAVVFCVAVAMRQVGLPSGGSLRLCIGSGIASAVGTYAFFLATHRGLLAVTAVITSLYPAGTIVLARLLLHERLTRLRILGLGLAAISIGLIAASAA